MSLRSVRNILSVLFVALILYFSANAIPNPDFSRHKYHTSLTRIDYNAKKSINEITIQLFTHDLLPLLEKVSNKNIDLDTKEADALIFEYIKKNFVLTNPQKLQQNLKWIGKERDIDTVWIYVETEAIRTPENYTLKNTIFFESYPEQTNLVICRYAGKKADLVFKVGDGAKKILVITKKK